MVGDPDGDPLVDPEPGAELTRTEVERQDDEGPASHATRPRVVATARGRQVRLRDWRPRKTAKPRS